MIKNYGSYLNQRTITIDYDVIHAKYVEISFQSSWNTSFMIVFGYAPFFSGCITSAISGANIGMIQGKLFAGNAGTTKFYYKGNQLVIYLGANGSQIHAIVRTPEIVGVRALDSYDLTDFTETNLA